MASKNYQLTDHPSGSIREIWSVSYPIITGLFSFGLMFFIDRLLLALYSFQALNAATNAGTALFLMLAVPASIIAIAEVFVGRSHGSGNFKNAGQSVWQMIWFSLMITPVIWVSGWILGPLLFYETGNEILEYDFFIIGLLFTPIFCVEIALGSFFIGIGQLKIVTIATLLANFINIGLDILLIFGLQHFPSYGVKGAALATGLSQLFQVVFYAILFFNRENRFVYLTDRWKFDRVSFIESIKVGIPVGFGKFMETLAHFIFFRMMILAGGDSFTIASIVQSIYILLSCSTAGISQAVKTIVSNLIGGNQLDIIGKVLKSALSLHFLLFLILCTILYLFGDQIGNLFFYEHGEIVFNHSFISSLRWCFFCMSLFYLFDGFSWIFIGQLTAAADVKFVLYASILTNWVLYVAPVIVIVNFFAASIMNAWFVMIFFSVSNFIILSLRYFSGKWRYTSNVFTNSSFSNYNSLNSSSFDASDSAA